MPRRPLGNWRAAQEASTDGNWKAAAAVLCQRIDVFPPAAAAALLLLYDNETEAEATQLRDGEFNPHDGIGFSCNDRNEAHELCTKLREGETLLGLDAARCVRYARAHAEQVMHVCGTSRTTLRVLFHGRDAATGQRLRMARHHGGADGDDRFSDNSSASYDSGSTYPEEALPSAPGEKRRAARPADDASSTDASSESDEWVEEDEEDEEDEEEEAGKESPTSSAGTLRLVPATVAARDVAAARVELLREQYEVTAAAAAAVHKELRAAQQVLRRAERRAAKDEKRHAAEDDDVAALAVASSDSERRRCQAVGKSDQARTPTPPPPEGAELESMPAAAMAPARRRLRRMSERPTEPCSDAAPQHRVRRKLVVDSSCEDE